MEAVVDRKTKLNMAGLMANDSLTDSFVAGACLPIITVSDTVIPALHAVIPAKAGIQRHAAQRTISTTALDTRLRGYDGIQWADSAEAGRVGV